MGNFAEYSSLGFYFNFLNISFYFLLACMVSDEKPSVILFPVSLYVGCYPFPPTPGFSKDFFFVFFFFSCSLNMVYLRIDIFGIYPA